MIEGLDAFTSEGNIVLDPFAGSGVVGDVATRLGRIARLLDITDAKS